MEGTLYYLKPGVIIEPVIGNWYAHSYLISPATYPMVLKDKVKLMQSFVASPELHEMATQDSEVVGRTFLNVPAAKVKCIEEMLEMTIAENGKYLEFADAVNALYLLLLKDAKGYSLEGLYRQVPERLKGYVELLYDVNNQPGFRFFESMLYRSGFQKSSAQGLYFYEMDPALRGNILDTPRMPDANSHRIQLPFSSETVDAIAQLREKPQIKQTITQYFQDDVFPLFDKLFTAEKPYKPQDATYAGPGIRIRYYGHACVLLETKEVSVLIDPFINYGASGQHSNFNFSDLPGRIDYVLITHNHGDHIIPEYLLQLRHKIGHVIVPRNGNGNLEDPSLKLLLESIGFPHVLELDELASIKIPGGEIIGMPFLGEHCDLTIHSKILHLVKLYGKSILLASDSSNLEIQVYRILREIIGTIDVLFLGMESEGAPLSLNYAPFMTKELNKKMDHSRRVNGSDFESGYAIVNEFRPKEVYIYAMGIEPWTRYILGIKYTEESVQLGEADKMLKACRGEGIHAELLENKKELYLHS